MFISINQMSDGHANSQRPGGCILGNKGEKMMHMVARKFGFGVISNV